MSENGTVRKGKIFDAPNLSGLAGSPLGSPSRAGAQTPGGMSQVRLLFSFFTFPESPERALFSQGPQSQQAPGSGAYDGVPPASPFPPHMQVCFVESSARDLVHKENRVS